MSICPGAALDRSAIFPRLYPMSPQYQLTALERRCLSLAAFGKSAVEIGRVVGASEREVDTLLFCTQRKLGAANRLQAVARGMSLGLIDASLAG